MFPNKEKLALFSDGANLYATAKSLGFDSEFDGEQYAKNSSIAARSTLYGSSVESLFELTGGPRLDEAQADFRLLASSDTRLEKSIILTSAVSYQNHPQRIVNVGGVAAIF